jgi:hypothetical protein
MDREKWEGNPTPPCVFAKSAESIEKEGVRGDSEGPKSTKSTE